LLELLVAIITQRRECFPRISRAYYALLSNLFSSARRPNLDKEHMLNAIRAPLVEHIELDNNGKPLFQVYHIVSAGTDRNR
jgi:ubiquitin-protein ligase E3 C